MNADLLYAILMSVGWIFLFGWLALLVIACGLAFRSEVPCSQDVHGFANRHLQSEAQLRHDRGWTM